MGLFIFMAIDVIAIIVLVIRYVHVNARSLSEAQFEAEARKQARKLRYQDPVITCDFCGAKIDTSKEKVCPNCGAPYGKDSEWVSRYQPDMAWADESSEAAYRKKVRQARSGMRWTLAGLRIAIGIAVFFLVLVITAAVSDYVRYDLRDYAEDEALNAHSYDHYVQVDYQVDEEDRVLLEEAGIRVSIPGFYAQQTAYAQEQPDLNRLIDSSETEADLQQYVRQVRMGIQIENTAGEDRILYLDLGAVNGVAEDRGLVYGQKFRKGKTVTLYPNLYGVRGGVVKDLVFGEISVRDAKRNLLWESDGYRKVSTDAEVSFPEPALPAAANLIFDERGIRIYAAKYADTYQDESRRELWIFNDSGRDYSVSSSDITVDGSAKEMYLPNLYGSPLPDRTVLISSGMYLSFRDEDPAAYDQKSIVCSFTFTGVDDPSATFSTPFLRINQFE